MDTLTGVPTVNVKEALSEKQYEEMIHYSEKCRLSIFSAWSEENKALVKRIIHACEKTLRFFSEWIKSQNVQSQMIYELGCLRGVISSISHVIYCEQKKEEIASLDHEYRSKLQYVNHLVDIVKILDKEGSLSHTDLCQKLRMNQSTLSEAMKKILAESVITSTISGKYKVYSLTDQGRHYARYIKSIKAPFQLSDDSSEEKNDSKFFSSETNSIITNNNQQNEKVALYEGDKACVKSMHSLHCFLEV